MCKGPIVKRGDINLKKWTWLLQPLVSQGPGSASPPAEGLCCLLSRADAHVDVSSMGSGMNGMKIC